MKMLRMFLVVIALMGTAMARDDKDFGRDHIGQWCRNRIAILERAERDALTAYSYGEIEEALDHLVRGLRRAEANIEPYYTGALTTKAIRRGLSIYEEMDEVLEGQRLRAKTLAHFLFEDYIFIKEVANKLDIPYYSSSKKKRCFYCKNKGHKKFEKLFINFSRKQVRMVLDHLADEDWQEGVKTVFPLGDSAGYLSALELSVNYLADDLASSFYANKYACAIEDLDYLFDRLYQYNHDGTGYPNDFIAVQQSYFDARAVVGGSGSGCGLGRDFNMDYGSSEKSRTKTIRRQNYYVRNGETTRIDLRGEESQYIEKLIIYAEGVRYDASFEVTVNGRRRDIKGTVYAPGRDPRYFVTIKEPVRSIEFRGTMGKAKVLKIKAVYQHRWW